MKIHHLRSATFVIESGENYILVDPMLSKKGELPPFAYFRHKAKRNPLVPLPANAAELLANVTHCIITHSQKWGIGALAHTDHLDKPGKTFLVEKKIPVVCSKHDLAYMVKNHMNAQVALDFWQAENWLGGKISAVPAQHGHSWIHHFMANGAGFFIELPEEPTIYISGDTVYTADVEKALTELKPDIAVVASGSACLDVGGYILMSPKEVISFIRTAPGKVIANHLEALNHCPTTRTQLKNTLENEGLMSKVFIPADGESVVIDQAIRPIQ